MKCVFCDWPLDEEHIFNVNCAAANAENDQIIAQVAESQRHAPTPEDLVQIDKARVVASESLAFARFVRLVRQP